MASTFLASCSASLLLPNPLRMLIYRMKYCRFADFLKPAQGWSLFLKRLWTLQFCQSFSLMLLISLSVRVLIATSSCMSFLILEKDYSDKRSTFVARAVATLGLSGPKDTFKDATAASEICRASVYLHKYKQTPSKNAVCLRAPPSKAFLMVGFTLKKRSPINIC